MYLRVLTDTVQDGDGQPQVELRAPMVGLFAGTPQPGTFLRSGSTAGRLQVLHRRYNLVVPDGVMGHVAAVLHHDAVVPVTWGAPLFRLTAAADHLTLEPVSAAADEVAETGLADSGVFQVRASTMGTFYRKPEPAAPNYASEGDRVLPGATLGLIEVMKVFNQVVYEGDCPAEIVKVLGEDGEEVQDGQALFLVRPEC
jgi:acetyl-CoA carboxylase biotin carboxyl carrier protein